MGYFGNGAVLQSVMFAAARADGFVVFIKKKAFAVFAHPADGATRVTHDECIRRHIAGNYSTGTDESIRADIVSTNDRGISAYGGASPDMRLAVFVFAFHGAARVDDVGENHGRAKKHIVGADYSGV